ncbi:DUF3808 domain-containing protein [Flavobacteriales bacterium]|nr:DUF3808 domain-containing protein [Flavobacteriales bacterium]MDB4051876.1 DUF3808 domain-containing protein [Flavobacteriales bacterium]
MKKNLVLLGLIVVTATAGMAQKKNVTTAIMKDKNGYFVAAKPYIDKASKHEDTQNQAKTWYYKALIYSHISESTKKDAMELKKTINFSEEVLAAMKKSAELDKKGDFTSKLKNLAGPMYGNALNNGIEQYNNKDYKGAFANFTASQEYAKVLGLTDTIGAYNGAMAATLIENYEGAIENYKKCVSYGYGGADVYLKLMDVYNKADKKEEATKVLEEAKAKFPNEAAIILNEAKILIENKEYEKAKASLESALAKDPNNFSLQYAAGITYNDLEMYDKAITAYKKALEIEPKNYNATFNLCAAYNNKVADMDAAAQDIPYNETAKFDAAKKERNDYIMEVLPFIEEAYQVEKEDGLKRILNTFYNLTRQADKIIK